MSTEIDEYLRKLEWIQSAGSALLEHVYSPAEVNKRVNKRVKQVNKEFLEPVQKVFGECKIIDD
jgi:hypothetical protein|tara:strand:- start:307 stop:498 length:192 start_codon:yes stop_codon:yes gene_type:complete